MLGKEIRFIDLDATESEANTESTNHLLQKQKKRKAVSTLKGKDRLDLSQQKNTAFRPNEVQSQKSNGLS